MVEKQKHATEKWICIIHELLYTDNWQGEKSSSTIDNEPPGGHKKGLRKALRSL